MVSYSPEAMAAYAALYSPYNDLDIYVEDRTLIGLYERVLARLLPLGARLVAVIPLEGKRGVLNEAERLKADNSRKRLFLLDGDFDWSVGRKRNLPNVYYLQCYSFENLAWDYEAIIRTAMSLSPDALENQVRSLLSEQKLNQHVSRLLPLFHIYAACKLLGSTQETVSFSVARLLLRNPNIELCPIKVGARVHSVESQLISEKGLARVERRKNAVQEKLVRMGRSDGRFISGKDYLLPIIMREFQYLFNYRGNKNQLLSLILQNSDLNIDKGLKRAIRNRFAS